MTESENRSLPSVVIPTRTMLCKVAFELVPLQTYGIMEVVMVDDISYNDTPEVIPKISGRIIFIISEDYFP